MRPRRPRPTPAPPPPICPRHSSFTPDCIDCCPRPKPEGWIGEGEVATKLAREADLSARALGHVLTGWIEGPPGTLRARCFQRGCHAGAVMRVRQWHGSPLGGEALAFRCKGSPR